MVIELGDNITRILIRLIYGTAIVCGIYLFARGLAYYLSSVILMKFIKGEKLDGNSSRDDESS